MTISKNENLAFLADGGETGAMMRARDWSDSPLGPAEYWPQSLRAVVGLMLGSKFPMFVAWGPSLHFLYNDAYAEILGAKHPFALGNEFHQVWPEIWPEIFPIIEKALAGQPSYFENLPLTVNRRGYSEDAWFTFSYSPTRNENGEVVGIFCAVTETTSHVLVERQSTSEYERMRRLFQKAPGFIAVLREPNHIFEIANDAYHQLIGHRDVIGKPVAQALPEVVDQGFIALLDEVYSTGKPFSGREVQVMLQRQPNAPLEARFVSLVYQPTFDFRGNVTGIFVEGSDVTDAVHAHHAIRDNEQRLRQLANTIPQLAWIAGPDGTMQWYNDRWYEFTGLTADEMTGQGWQKVQHPDHIEEVTRQWQHSLDTGTPFEMSLPMRGADGAYRTFYTLARPLRDISGAIVQWFGTNTDVTALENAQKELSAASKRKDEFLAMLAHELRNPLAPIATAAELLKLSTLDETRVRNASAVISRQVAHMKDLIDDLLDVSRVTTGLVTLTTEILTVSSVLADAVEQTRLIMENKRHHFTMHVPNRPLFIKGDRTRMIQVFSNLLNNAAKYTPAGGRIEVRVETLGASVNIDVEDNGIGVEPLLQAHIFELFTQGERTPDRAQGGLGIGLALVKSLIELQGGTVSMRSDGSGKGSIFSIHLPLEQEAESAILTSATSNTFQPSEKTARVLVIDDNQDAADTLALLLQALGHDATVAYDPLAALAMVDTTLPEVLFIDIGLPGMDGYELARRLRLMPQTKRSALIAVSGYGQPQDKERGQQAGFDHHLVKPVSVDQVIEILATVMDPTKAR